MLIVRPYGMSAEVAARITQQWDNEGTDNEGTYIEEWLRENPKHEELYRKLKVYTTPGDIASYRRGYRDAILGSRPLAYFDYYGALVNTVQDTWSHEAQRVIQPKGWEPRDYVEGWKRATDMGTSEEVGWSDVSHYRITTYDAGNFSLYVREMSFDCMKGEVFSWNKIGDYIIRMAPNAIDHVSVTRLQGRTMDDEVLEIPPVGWSKDHDVGTIRTSSH